MRWGAKLIIQLEDIETAEEESGNETILVDDEEYFLAE